VLCLFSGLIRVSLRLLSRVRGRIMCLLRSLLSKIDTLVHPPL